MYHSCGRYRISDHFRASDPDVKRAYRVLTAAVRSLGPVQIYAEKTRIVFQVRARFGGVTVRRKWIDLAFILARPLRDPRVIKLLPPSMLDGKHYGAYVRLTKPADVDDQVKGWLSEARLYGTQDQQPSHTI